MANKHLFSTQSSRGKSADTINRAGGKAYSLSSEHALAQVVATGCMNGTYYATAEEHLDEILSLASAVAPEFVAQCSVYGRSSAYMKDAPALLVAWLSCNGHNSLARKIFHRVVDNGKMLRNYVQIIRSGRLGRKSLGSGRSQPKGLVLDWLGSQSDDQLFRASVGNDPSLADVIKMVHPRPTSVSRNALYAYLLGKAYDLEALPEVVRDYEMFKVGELKTPPKVDFRMLTSLGLSKENWKQIAMDAAWTMTRMNLNTFSRHGLFEDEEVVDVVARRLADPAQVKKARCFPYQLLMAFLSSGDRVPVRITNALQDAMEIAVDNVPQFTKKDGSPAKVWVFPDVSGSMSCPVTGYSRVPTQVKCLHVAALVSACVLRRNPEAGILPFSHELHDVKLNPRDSIMTNAKKLAINGGGTHAELPMRALNGRNEKGDLLIYVSDNESWMGQRDAGWHRRSNTGTMDQFLRFKDRNPGCKMVCIDVVPNQTTQACESADVLNVGGFSDAVFDVVGNFLKNGHDAEPWVKKIQEIEL